MRVFAYIAIALLASAAGFGIYRQNAGPDLSSSAAHPGPVSEALAIPEVLPDFTLLDLEGTPRSIQGWPGKSMIVNFWATWCEPCRREIPLLMDLQRQHGEAGFQVVGVAVDFREDVLRYAQNMGIEYPLLIGEQDGLAAVNQFGQAALGFPFTVFTDDQHRIVLFHLGEITPPQAEVLLEAVNRVNRGELTVDEARAAAAREIAALEARQATVGLQQASRS
jgi:thiol-disulfide isomerase/thioredoxin